MRRVRTVLALVAVLSLCGVMSPANAVERAAPAVPQMIGSGGAVSSVDEEASQVGIDVLARGGNAVDAAVATGAVLGVTSPFSTGIGGGGFFVYYEARTGNVYTINGREKAPATYDEKTFTDENGDALEFDDVRWSGMSVGVPGVPATWDKATRRWGSKSFSSLLKPAERIARDGFTVGETFHSYTASNAEDFRRFPETARVFLHDGEAPAVGSTFRNPDMARTYHQLRTKGVESLYRGPVGAAVVDAVRHPETAPGETVLAGEMTRGDMRAYKAPVQAPTRARYSGLDVYGMAAPSSGGIAVGEALNLQEAYEKRTGKELSDVGDTQYRHRQAESTATAFADRNRYVADVRDVPQRELLSQAYANDRACELFDARRAHERPIPFGEPDGAYDCKAGTTSQGARDDHGTTHLTTADRWGNVVAFTSTIESIGGSGLTVPGHGFLLNNELTDFEFVPPTAGVPHPNLPGPGKRPRSSMSPTIVVDGDRPVLAAGAAGGSTIITSVFGIVTGSLDRGLPMVDAIAAPRLSSRNGPATDAEPAIADTATGEKLRAMGHELTRVESLSTATGIRILPRGRFEAAAETARSGGGSAMVVRPDR